MFGKMMNSFYYGKSGKGDFRKEDLPKNRWQLFWEMLRVRFSALCRLNLMTLAAWLPLIIVIGMCVSTLLNVMSITGDYSNYVQTGDAGNLSEEQIAALGELNVTEFTLNMFQQSVSTMLLWLIPAILITGPVQAGMAYVTRNWSRDEHAFIWADFKDAVKENWKQALGVSAVTSVLPLIMYVCYRFYGGMTQQSAFYILPQMLVIMLGLVWTLGTVFMYPMMVSYKVTFRDLVKNSVMLAIARLPQTVGVRLVVLLPMLIGLSVFYFTASPLVLLIVALYYAVMGYAMTRFVFASYTNAVFDRYVNSHIEGAKVNRGLATDTDDEDADDENAPEDSKPAEQEK